VTLSTLTALCQRDRAAGHAIAASLTKRHRLAGAVAGTQKYTTSTRGIQAGSEGMASSSKQGSSPAAAASARDDMAYQKPQPLPDLVLSPNDTPAPLLKVSVSSARTESTAFTPHVTPAQSPPAPGCGNHCRRTPRWEAPSHATPT
jgi:hypothetical protein